MFPSLLLTSCELRRNFAIYQNRCKWRKGRRFLHLLTQCQVRIGGSLHVPLQMNLKPPQSSETSPVHRNWNKSQNAHGPLENHKVAEPKRWCAQPHGEVSTRIACSPHETFWLSRHSHLRYFGHKHLLPQKRSQVSDHVLPRNNFPAVAVPHSLEPDISPPCP